MDSRVELRDESFRVASLFQTIYPTCDISYSFVSGDIIAQQAPRKSGIKHGMRLTTPSLLHSPLTRRRNCVQRVTL